MTKLFPAILTSALLITTACQNSTEEETTPVDKTTIVALEAEEPLATILQENYSRDYLEFLATRGLPAEDFGYLFQDAALQILNKGEEVSSSPSSCYWTGSLNDLLNEMEYSLDTWDGPRGSSDNYRTTIGRLRRDLGITPDYSC